MATAVKFATDVKIVGPWVDGVGYSNPIVREFFTAAERELADVGVTEIRARIGRKAKHPTGSFAGAVVAKDRAVRVSYPQVLRGPWLEGTSSRNKSTRFKGYSIFREVRDYLTAHATELTAALRERTIARLNGGG